MGAAILLGALAILTAGDVIDRIAAVVNDEVILLSEVDEKLFILDSQGQLAGRDSSEVYKARRDILDRLIEERLVVQRARSQGITVDEQEVTARVDAALQQVRSQFPSEEAFGRCAGGSASPCARALRERRAAGALAQKIVGRRSGRWVTASAQVLMAQGRAAAEAGGDPPGSRRGLSDRSRHGPAASERIGRARAGRGKAFESVAPPSPRTRATPAAGSSASSARATSTPTWKRPSIHYRSARSRRRCARDWAIT
jgi:hypothetical protein